MITVHMDYTPGNGLGLLVNIISLRESLGLAFQTALQPLVQWKTKKGFNVDLVYTNQIGSSASNIKSYIMTQYNNANPAPSFVLIVGDTPQIPASYTSGGHVSDLDYCDMTNNGIPDILMGRFSAQTPEPPRSAMRTGSPRRAERVMASRVSTFEMSWRWVKR